MDPRRHHPILVRGSECDTDRLSDSIQSNKANFKIECQKRKPTVSHLTVVQATAPIAVLKPVITGYRHAGQCVAKGSRFAILGNHFGDQRVKSVGLGGRRIHVDLPVAPGATTRSS